MRIKPDEYEVCSVKSLSEIISSAINLKKNCEMLLEYEDAIRGSINQAQQDFDTSNYEKVYETINSFKSKVIDFENELNELVDSVKEYANDKEFRWS